MTTKKLVIFDCDGTLVDTEYLSALALADSLKSQGLSYTADQIRNEFLGVANKDILATLSARHTITIDAGAVMDAYRANMAAGMDEHMRVFARSRDFVRELAARKDVLVTVASNGTKDVVIEELRHAGFLEIIPLENIYAARDVARPKPFPDLYLHVAERMGVPANDCTVVEDSPVGARAGLAAGMRVVGYTGLAHDPAAQRRALVAAGVAEIIETLEDLTLADA